MELGCVGGAEPGNKPWFAFFGMHSLPMIIQLKIDLYTNSSHHSRSDVFPHKSRLTGCSRGRSSGATWIPQLKVRRKTLLSDLQPSLSSSCRSLLFNALFTSPLPLLSLPLSFINGPQYSSPIVLYLIAPLRRIACGLQPFEDLGFSS